MKALVLIALVAFVGCGKKKINDQPAPTETAQDKPAQKPNPTPQPEPEPVPETQPQPEPDPEPTESKVSWAEVSGKIFQSKCVACHNPSGQVPWIDLSSFDAFIKNERISKYDPANPQANRLLERVMETAEPMPPPPIARLTDEELELLLKWYEAGTPE